MNRLPDNGVRFLNPYRDTAALYRQAGWRGPIPLPHKEKHPPPTGFTGHAAPYPTDDKILEWSSDGVAHNIGIRLAGVDNENEIVGIDVDHYLSGDKDKRGGDQLKALEDRLGTLPPTWISSARTDGISGIRYYRVPRGMAFRGQVDKDIECICKGYRFAVVFPSIHPNGEQYRWYAPGVLPVSGGTVSGELPDARQLPFLPAPWLSYLTDDLMRAGDADIIDMQSSVGEIYDWADSTFHKLSDDDSLCTGLRKKVDKQKKDIIDEATSHDKILKAHYNIFMLAMEGHVGWENAVNEVEQFWADEVIKHDKRGLDELKQELFRSRINGLRKIKARSDQRVAVGAPPVDMRCDKTGACGSPEGTGTDAGASAAGPPDDPLHDIPRGPIRPVDEYDMNDHGNAQHLVDMFSNVTDGCAIRHAKGYGWLIWHNGNSALQPHWELDVDGDQELMRMWERVEDRQKDYVEALRLDWEQEKTNNAGVVPIPDSVKFAKQRYDKWKAFAKDSGNVRPAQNALTRVKSKAVVNIDVNLLDRNANLLGVSNGVLDLESGVKLRRALPTDYITLNTHQPWGSPSKHAEAEWQKYLDTFLPDKDLQHTAQVVLGHCIIGGNPQKKMIVLKGKPNTGKSMMVNSIEAALGDYAQSVGQTIFQNHKLNPVLANAINKRIIVCSEFDEEDKLSASTIKRLTGATDKVQAELKGSNQTIEGTPQFVPILATNSVPSISGADKALQDRLYVIPFNVTPDHIDKQKAMTLQNVCGPAVLAWLVEGYQEYSLTHTLPEHISIIRETKEFGSQLDPVGEFIEEFLIKHDKFDENKSWEHVPEWCVLRSVVFSQYEEFQRAQRIPAKDCIGPNKLTRRLQASGIPTHSDKKRINGVVGMFWMGVQLRNTSFTSSKLSDITHLIEKKKSDATQTGEGTNND